MVTMPTEFIHDVTVEWMRRMEKELTELTDLNEKAAAVPIFHLYPTPDATLDATPIPPLQSPLSHPYPTPFQPLPNLSYP